MLISSDGTTAYIYDPSKAQKRRISQTSTQPPNISSMTPWEVPLWGQLTSASGQVTSAKSYDPYGVVTQTIGAGQSAYGYTGEQQDAASGMVYLRARYYNVNDGRFQSRDTWGGDANSPMSMNRWGYVEGNPVNLTDPSGYHPDCDKDYPALNITYIENNYSNFLSKSDWHDTYVAAGIAVQCWATDLDWWFPDEGDGEGDAQTTDRELRKAWGKVIKNEKTGEIIGYGKLCYIVAKATGDVPCVCEDKEKLIEQYGKDNVRDENPVDQNTTDGAAISMWRRIWQVLDSCTDCTATDLFIAAALAQDVQLNWKEMSIASGNGKHNSRYDPETHGLKIDWADFYEENKKYDTKNTYKQVARFDDAVKELINRGWAIPTLNRRGIEDYRVGYP